MAKKTPNKLVQFAFSFLEGVRTYGWIGIAAAVGFLAISAISAREASHVETVDPVILPLADGKALVTEEELLARLAAGITKPMSELSLSDIDVWRVEDVLEGQAFVEDADAYIDDDLIAGDNDGEPDDWMKFSERIEFKSAADKHGIVLFDKTNFLNYLNLHQSGDQSFLSNSAKADQFFMKSIGRDVEFWGRVAIP